MLIHGLETIVALFMLLALWRRHMNSEPNRYERENLQKLFLEFNAVKVLVQTHEEKHGEHTIGLVRRAEAVARGERVRLRKNRVAEAEALAREKDRQFYQRHLGKNNPRK